MKQAIPIRCLLICKAGYVRAKPYGAPYWLVHLAVHPCKWHAFDLGKCTLLLRATWISLIIRGTVHCHRGLIQAWNQVTWTVPLLFSIAYWWIRPRRLLSAAHYERRKQAIMFSCVFAVWSYCWVGDAVFFHSKETAWSFIHSLIVHHISDAPPSQLQVFPVWQPA